MDIDGAGLAEVLVAPDLFEQLLPREDDALVLGELLEQFELLVAQRQRRAVEPDFASIPVEVERSDGDATATAGGVARLRSGQGGPAQDRLDARRQLARMKRLAEVVVRPEFESDDAVDVLGAGGQHQDRGVADWGCVGAEFPRDFVARLFRQHQVEHDQVGRSGAGGGKRRFAVVGCDHRESLTFEIEGAEFADVRLVIDDEDGPVGAVVERHGAAPFVDHLHGRGYAASSARRQPRVSIE